jgi:methylated-DNA-[protein]-cysteine S-methyltransferase
MNTIQFKYDSKIGPLYLVATEKGLSGIYWKEMKVPLTLQSNLSPYFDMTIAQLDEYFKGTRKEFQIPLDIKGTDFQVQVWKELQNIPYGETLSYKKLAEKISCSRYSRAVGTANGKNPLSIIIPCHRVISSDGTLGGYAGGLANKSILLNLERD